MLPIVAAALFVGMPARAIGENAACPPDDERLRLSTILTWSVPAEPVKIVGSKGRESIYFVGTKGLGVWLITTPQGHILLNTGTGISGPLIEESLYRLKLDPRRIKFLLAGHAHVDHVGGHAYIRAISGAKIVMIDRERELLESGGWADFHYGYIPLSWFRRVKVDRELKSGDAIKLGDVTITAHLTPGHTKGSTTWVTSIREDGRDYTVVFPDGTSVNPGYRLVKNPSYEGIVGDYRSTFALLEELKPDIWLAAHTEFFDFERKRALAVREGVKAWIDPHGYKCWVANQRRKFESELEDQVRKSRRADLVRQRDPKGAAGRLTPVPGQQTTHNPGVPRPISVGRGQEGVRPDTL